jgi:hypothetical protein
MTPADTGAAGNMRVAAMVPYGSLLIVERKLSLKGAGVAMLDVQGGECCYNAM